MESTTVSEEWQEKPGGKHGRRRYLAHTSVDVVPSRYIVVVELAAAGAVEFHRVVSAAQKRLYRTKTIRKGRTTWNAGGAE